MIWFYPLNAMEVSGYEVFLLVLFSPLLLESSYISRVVLSRHGAALFSILTLTSLTSFHLTSTLLRLTVLALGNFFAMLLFTVLLSNPSQSERSVRVAGRHVSFNTSKDDDNVKQ